MKETTSYKELQNYQNKQHGLRFSASNVAAMTGFNPFKNLPALVMELVYQDFYGQLLLQRDVEALGIILVSEEQVLRDLAAKGQVTQDLQMAFDVKSGLVQSVEEAASIKNNLMEQAKKKGLLTKEEQKKLNEEARRLVDTGFGTINEGSALDIYEKQCGWEIRERNSTFREWKFRRLGDYTVEPIGAPAVLEHKLSNVENGVADICKDDDALFSIVGIADGVRDELWNSSNCSIAEDEWTLRQVVVEVKHRMKRAQIPPPFYDQIQAVVYCFMYNVDEAEIIQVTRRHKKKRRKQILAPQKTSECCQEENDCKQLKVTNTSNNETNKGNYSSAKLHDSKNDTPYVKSTGPKTPDAEGDRPIKQTGDGKKNVTKNNEGTASAKYCNDDKATTRSSPHVDILACRVSLDDPLLRHRSNWNEVILPRLRSFAEMIFSIRSDDTKRYQFLMSLSEENEKDAWNLVLIECPWLNECDIAFHRL